MIVSAAAHRPAWCRGSAQAKYSVSHHDKPFFTRPSCWIRWVWSTVVRRPSEVCDTVKLSWQCLRRSAVPESRDKVGAHQKF